MHASIIIIILAYNTIFYFLKQIKKSHNYYSFKQKKYKMQLIVKKQNFLTCSGENQATMYCLNAQCKQSILFTCGNQDCKCQQEHEQCSGRGMIKFTLKKINEKNDQTDANKMQIQKIFEKIIDEISLLRENILKDIQDELKEINLSKSEKIFMHLYQGKSQLKLTVKQLKALWQSINQKQSEQKNEFKGLLEQLNCFSTASGQKIIEFQTFMNEFKKQKLKDISLSFQEYQIHLVDILQRIKNIKLNKTQMDNEIEKFGNSIDTMTKIETMQKLNNIFTQLFKLLLKPLNQLQSEFFNSNLKYQGINKSKYHLIIFCEIGNIIKSKLQECQRSNIMKSLQKFEPLLNKKLQGKYLISTVSNQFSSNFMKKLASLPSSDLKNIVNLQIKFLKQNEQQIMDRFSSIEIIKQYFKLGFDLNFQQAFYSYSLHQVYKILKEFKTPTVYYLFSFSFLQFQKAKNQLNKYNNSLY